MPSEHAKKKAAKKKELAKQKGGKKATTTNGEENGVSNGVSELEKLKNGSKETSSEPLTYEG